MVSSAKSFTSASSTLIPSGIGGRRGCRNFADPRRTQTERLASSNRGIEKAHSSGAPESIIFEILVRKLTIDLTEKSVRVN